jgi:DNA-directed RNA polymerase specialized sigma24 family protein
VHAPIRKTTRGQRALTPLAFKRLLEWLDGEIDSRGKTYLEMRRRLVSYFDRRNRLSADELADETLNRIARTLEQSGVIRVTPPARYCYVVARFILLEDVRRERRHVRVDDPQRLDLPSESRRGLPERDAGLALRDERLDCLDSCLQKLQPEQRELVVDYYRDALRQKIDRRRDLAKRLGITMNALAIRAWRIRTSLETCVEACRKARGQIPRCCACTGSSAPLEPASREVNL